MLQEIYSKFILNLAQISVHMPQTVKISSPLNLTFAKKKEKKRKGKKKEEEKEKKKGKKISCSDHHFGALPDILNQNIKSWVPPARGYGVHVPRGSVASNILYVDMIRGKYT